MSSGIDHPEDAAVPGNPVLRLDADASHHLTPCGDGTMVWRSWGTGRGLVLLHGGAGSWQHWVLTIPAFSGYCRVLAPDLPGFGDSAMPSSSPDMATVSGTVAAGIDRLLGPHAIYDLVGFSFGTSVAGHVAMLHGERVRSVSLLAPFGLVPLRTPMILERVRDKTGAALTEAHCTNLTRILFADPAGIDALAIEIQSWNVAHARLNSRALSALGMHASLPHLHVPVNGIWGERDQLAYYDSLEGRIAAFRTLSPGAPGARRSRGGPLGTL